MFSSDESRRRAVAIASKGYFPSELPPVFSTMTFGQNIEKIITEWRNQKVINIEQEKIKSGKKKRWKSDAYVYKIASTEPESLSKPKRQYERRNLDIVHPVPQSFLIYEISEHFRRLSKQIATSSFSLDKAQVGEVYPRGIATINFDAHKAKKDYIEHSSDWLVQTDISRFYPSIYTHSISWALYGKEKVKSNIGKFRGSLGDRLDQLVRVANRNQTIGIPIGPETSRLLAECISASVDGYISKESKLISVEKADRLQDDWFIGAQTLPDSERILSKLVHAYREYNFEINGSKTSIDHISSSQQQAWKGELFAFLNATRGRLYGKTLNDFFDIVVRLQAENPNDSVIPYVLAIIQNRRFRHKDIVHVESFLLRASVIAPASMGLISLTFINLQHYTGEVSKKRLKERVLVLAENNLEKGNAYEAMWQLYTLRGLKISFKSDVVSDYMSVHKGSVLPLLLCDMKSKNLFHSTLPYDKWEDMLTPDRVMSDWSWLLGYEGIRNGWLKDLHGVTKQPFFSVLHANGIFFYDPSKNAPTLTSLKKKRFASKGVSLKQANQLIKELRGLKSRIAMGEYF
jgi:hypothetical protein